MRINKYYLKLYFLKDFYIFFEKKLKNKKYVSKY